jgi:DNA-binding CsgD family transcriptional regulator
MMAEFHGFDFWLVTGIGFLVGLSFVIFLIGFISRIRPYITISIWFFGVVILLIWNFEFPFLYFKSLSATEFGSVFFAIRCLPTFTFLFILRQVSILQKKRQNRFTQALNALLLLSFSLAFYQFISSFWFTGFSTLWVERIFWILVGVYAIIQVVWVYFGIRFTYNFTAFIGSFALPFLGFLIGVFLESQLAYSSIERNLCLFFTLVIQSLLILFLLLREVISNSDNEDIEQPQNNEIQEKDDRLSPRELEILTAYANGFTYYEISNSFLISPNTVKTHLRSCYKKLDINSKLEAAQYVENLKINI